MLSTGQERGRYCGNAVVMTLPFNPFRSRVSALHKVVTSQGQPDIAFTILIATHAESYIHRFVNRDKDVKLGLARSQRPMAALDEDPPASPPSAFFNDLFNDHVGPTLYPLESDWPFEPEDQDSAVPRQIAAGQEEDDPTPVNLSTPGTLALEELPDLEIPAEAEAYTVHHVKSSTTNMGSDKAALHQITFYSQPDSNTDRQCCGVWTPTSAKVLAGKLDRTEGTLRNWSKDKETHRFKHTFTAYSSSGKSFPYTSRKAVNEGEGHWARSEALNKGAVSIRWKATEAEPESTTYPAYHPVHRIPTLAEVKASLPHPVKPIQAQTARPTWLAATNGDDELRDDADRL